MQDSIGWQVCPECLWLGLTHDWPQLITKCWRPPDLAVHYGGVYGPLGALMRCREALQVPVPKHIADALWAALRLGGMNALVELINAIKPEDMGLLSSVERTRQLRARRAQDPGR